MKMQKYGSAVYCLTLLALLATGATSKRDVDAIQTTTDAAPMSDTALPIIEGSVQAASLTSTQEDALFRLQSKACDMGLLCESHGAFALWGEDSATHWHEYFATFSREIQEYLLAFELPPVA